MNKQTIDDIALRIAKEQEPVAVVDDAGVVIVCSYSYKPGDKLYLHPPTEAIEALRRDAERLGETVARAIYMQWRDVTGYVPWVEGGNSLMQDSARRIANTAIGAAMKESKNETT